MTIAPTPLTRAAFAEFLGTAFLLATVIGSRIMGETLAGGNVAVALLGNTLATGAMLVVLITTLGPVSGAHFNPAVTLAFLLQRDVAPYQAVVYGIAQVVGAVIGVWVAHGIFGQDLLQIATTVRSGGAQGFSEAVATFGLLITILGGLRHRPEAVPMLVGLYITAGYWFTASTSFANPAVTLARTLSDTFAGIAPVDAPLFVAMQVVGAVAGVIVAGVLFRR